MELAGIDDVEVGKKLETFSKSVDKMENTLEQILHEVSREDLNKKDQLNYDLFMAYMLNTLYWCYLRSNGIDPNGKKIKQELQRVREYMIKAKQAIDRHTIRPTVNQPVAERFVRAGIQKPQKRKLASGATTRLNKITKFADDDD